MYMIVFKCTSIILFNFTILINFTMEIVSINTFQYVSVSFYCKIVKMDLCLLNFNLKLPLGC